MHSLTRLPVCIIGAGPYGLSIAAHLRALGIDFRIFGHAMNTWKNKMPDAMFLKSEGSGSNLFDPSGHHTLARYCAAETLPYEDVGLPVSREIFTRYAMAFQRDLVPDVEDVLVLGLNRSRNPYEVALASGETLYASKVVVATGLDHMTYVPPVLSHLSAAHLTHSSEHREFNQFEGKDVAVVGAGQSALEIAALLHQEGASVRLLVRGPAIAWNSAPDCTRRTLYDRVRHPRTPLGDSPQLWFYCNAPGLFRQLPKRTRIERVKTVLGPAGAWWLKDQVVGRVPISLECHLVGAETRDGRVVLRVRDRNGEDRELTSDHVIAATGYKFDLQRLPFLHDTLKSGLRQEQGLPALSSHFESSLPGLYFTGLASSHSFGPVMRFLQGAGYTAQRISSHIKDECGQGKSPSAMRALQPGAAH
jgi:thioredoxin reductase